VVTAGSGIQFHIGALGSPLYEARFSELLPFHKGIAAGRDSLGWVHIDRNGSPVYRSRFSFVEPFYNGQARVGLESGAVGVIDENGGIIWTIESDATTELARDSRHSSGQMKAPRAIGGEGPGRRATANRLESALDKVVVVRYSPEWPRSFHRFERKLRSLIPTARIEHVGSTSVPGMEAKPIIDVSVGLPPGTRVRVDAARAIGLEFRSVSSESTHFVFRDKDGGHVAHVHVNPRDSEPELSLLRFRDFLRGHNSVAREYTETKRSILAANPSREGYTRAKSPFIRGLEGRVRRWAMRTQWKPRQPKRA
jgi:GrpB-like predicted nucleotidyltransferase (UPF0157 family)